MEFLVILLEATISMLFITLMAGLIAGLDKLWNKFVNIKNIRIVSDIESDDKFDIIYQDLLNYYKTKVEKQRKKEIIMVGGVLLTLVLTFASVLYIQKYTKYDYSIARDIGIVLIIIELYFIVKNITFRSIYKREIIERLAKSVNFSFEYRDKEREELENQYARIGFFDKPYNNISIDDYIVGFLDETATIAFADLALEKIEKHGDDSLCIPVFRGIVVRMTYNNDIRNNIVIEDRRIVDTGSELPEFFLNRLIEIYKKYGIVPEIRIKRNYVFLRIHTGAFFEPGAAPMNKQKIFNYYNVLKFINEVMLEIKNATEVK